MSNFDAGNWIAEQALTLPQGHIVEGVPFDLLSLELDDELLNAVKDCGTYNDMVLLAADSGLAYYDADDDACRVVDNRRLGKKVKSMWAKEELQLDTEPCIKERVGLKVCEISGLAEYVEDQRKLDVEIKKEEDDRAAEAKRHLEAEDKGNIVDGDDLGDTSVSLEELYKDKAAAKVA